MVRTAPLRHRIRLDPISIYNLAIPVFLALIKNLHAIKNVVLISFFISRNLWKRRLIVSQTDEGFDGDLRALTRRSLLEFDPLNSESSKLKSFMNWWKIVFIYRKSGAGEWGEWWPRQRSGWLSWVKRRVRRLRTGLWFLIGAVRCAQALGCVYYWNVIGWKGGWGRARMWVR